MNHPSVMPFRARKKHGWMAQKMCSKESANSMEALEKIKNHNNKYNQKLPQGGRCLETLFRGNK